MIYIVKDGEHEQPSPYEWPGGCIMRKKLRKVEPKIIKGDEK